MDGGGSDNATKESRGAGTYVSDDGTGGYGGGTVSATDKTTWSGFVGSFNGLYSTYDYYYGKEENGLLVGSSINDSINITESTDEWCAQGSYWIKKSEIYSVSGYSLLYGQGAGTATNFVSISSYSFNHYDEAGGGGGFYGGYASMYYNAGAGGGSAYADIEGAIKKVTNVTGYSGYENGDGEEMLGKYGNGKVIISQ